MRHLLVHCSEGTQIYPAPFLLCPGSLVFDEFMVGNSKTLQKGRTVALLFFDITREGICTISCNGGLPLGVNFELIFHRDWGNGLPQPPVSVELRVTLELHLPQASGASNSIPKRCSGLSCVLWMMEDLGSSFFLAPPRSMWDLVPHQGAYLHLCSRSGSYLLDCQGSPSLFIFKISFMSCIHCCCCC